MRSILIAILAVFLSVRIQLLPCQTNEYYVGTAISRNLQTAKDNALANLTQSIQVFISSRSTREVKESRKELHDSTYALTVAHSFLNLTDVEEKLETLNDGSFKVTKSVLKSSVRKIFEARRKKIIDYLDVARSVMHDSTHSSAFPLQTILDNYYQAYLLAMTYPDTINALFDAKRLSVQVGIPAAIQSMMRSVEFKPFKQIDDQYIVWKYSVTYEGRVISDLRYSFFDGMGETMGEVHRGETQITLYYPSKEKKERLVSLQLEFLSDIELDEDLSTIRNLIAPSMVVKPLEIKVPGEAKEAPPPTPVPAAIQALLEKRNSFAGIIEVVNNLVRRGIIVQGRASDFETLNGLYAIVVDKPGLVAVLLNTNNTYYDFITQKNVVLKEYVGKRIMWFDIIQKEYLR